MSVGNLTTVSNAAALALPCLHEWDDGDDELLNVQRMRYLILHRFILPNIHQYSQIEIIYL
jgi:hypothetical protein